MVLRCVLRCDCDCGLQTRRSFRRPHERHVTLQLRPCMNRRVFGSKTKLRRIPPPAAMPGGINDLNKGLGFGLNARGSAAAAGQSNKKKSNKKPKGKSVFDDEDDGSSSDESSSGAPAKAGGRSTVNAAIAQEQAALRRRAEAAMKAAAGNSSNINNYDEDFERFSASEQAKKDAARKQHQQQDEPERKSRYISTLLQTANKRKREQEIVHERRVAREQAAEEQSNAEEFAGKEKFVTKSYKRKLAEREEWLREEQKKEDEEKQAEVDRREGRGGLGMASFLGSVVRGGEDVGSSGSKKEKSDEEDFMGGNFLDGFARGDGDGGGDDANHTEQTDEYRPKLAAAQKQYDKTVEASPSQPTKEEEEASLRRERNAKIVAARERYLERKRSGKSASLFAAAY